MAKDIIQENVSLIIAQGGDEKDIKEYLKSEGYEIDYGNTPPSPPKGFFGPIAPFWQQAGRNLQEQGISPLVERISAIPQAMGSLVSAGVRALPAVAANPLFPVRGPILEAMGYPNDPSAILARQTGSAIGSLAKGLGSMVIGLPEQIRDEPLGAAADIASFIPQGMPVRAAKLLGASEAALKSVKAAELLRKTVDPSSAYQLPSLALKKVLKPSEGIFDVSKSYLDRKKLKAFEEAGIDIYPPSAVSKSNILKGLEKMSPIDYLDESLVKAKNNITNHYKNIIDDINGSTYTLDIAGNNIFSSLNSVTREFTKVKDLSWKKLDILIKETKPIYSKKSPMPLFPNKDYSELENALVPLGESEAVLFINRIRKEYKNSKVEPAVYSHIQNASDWANKKSHTIGEIRDRIRVEDKIIEKGFEGSKVNISESEMRVIRKFVVDLEDSLYVQLQKSAPQVAEDFFKVKQLNREGMDMIINNVFNKYNKLKQEGRMDEILKQVIRSDMSEGAIDRIQQIAKDYPYETKTFVDGTIKKVPAGLALEEDFKKVVLKNIYDESLETGKGIANFSDSEKLLKSIGNWQREGRLNKIFGHNAERILTNPDIIKALERVRTVTGALQEVGPSISATNVIKTAKWGAYAGTAMLSGMGLGKIGPEAVTGVLAAVLGLNKFISTPTGQKWATYGSLPSLTQKLPGIAAATGIAGKGLNVINAMQRALEPPVPAGNF